MHPIAAIAAGWTAAAIIAAPLIGRRLARRRPTACPCWDCDR